MSTFTCTECSAAVEGIPFGGLRESLCQSCHFRRIEAEEAEARAAQEEAERRVRECEEALEEAEEEAELNSREAERNLADARERLRMLVSLRAGGQP